MIKSVVKWWFRLFTVGSVSTLLGVIVFIRTEIIAGMMSQSAYVYAGVINARLEGLIEKDYERMYRLTPFGLKALDMLNSLSKEIDNEMVQVR